MKKPSRFVVLEKEKLTFTSRSLVILDKETGVTYLYVADAYSGGLTPLLDADGKPLKMKDM